MNFFITKTFARQLLFILLLTAGNTYSQRFKPGVIAGFVATDQVGVDPLDNDFHKAGFTLGGLLNTKLSEKNSIQFEILYVQKGSLQPGDSLNNYNFYKLSLDYIEVPLMFRHNVKFNMNKKPVDRFYIEAGPSFGRLVRTYINNNGIISTAGNFKNNELALNLGIGFTIVNNLSFNLRYSSSIIPVVVHPLQVDRFIWYTFNKGDNVVFSFSLRYIFDRESRRETKKPDES